MENGIVSKVSLRTSQTRKYNRIYVMIKVWGSLGSIKSIHRVTVSTPLTSNAPSVVSVTVLSRLEEQKTLTVTVHTTVEVKNPGHKNTKMIKM